MSYFKQDTVHWLISQQQIEESHKNAQSKIASFKQVQPSAHAGVEQRAIWNARSAFLMSKWGFRPFIKVSKAIERRFDLKAMMFSSELLTSVCMDVNDMLKPIRKSAVNRMISDRWKDLHRKNQNPAVVPNPKNKMKFGVTIYIPLPDSLQTREELLEVARTALTGLDFKRGNGTFFVLTSHDDNGQFICIVMIPAVYYGEKKHAPVYINKDGKYRSRKTGHYCPAEDADAYCVEKPGKVVKDFVYFGMSTHFGSSSDTRSNCQSRQSFTDKSRITRQMLADTFYTLGCQSKMVLLGRYDRNAKLLQTKAATRNIKMYNGYFQRLEDNTLIPLIYKVKKMDDRNVIIALKKLVLRLRKLQYQFIKTDVKDLERYDLLIRFIGMPIQKAKYELAGLEIRMQREINKFMDKYCLA